MPGRSTVRKLRTIMRGFLVSLAGWGIVLIVNWLLGARLPPSKERDQTLILLVFVVEFLFLKAWLMAVNTDRSDRLGWSLIAFNSVFAVAYFATIEIALLPALLNWRYVVWVLWAAIWLVTLWGIVELLLVPDPPCNDPEDTS